jgi:hypothetical protein
MGFYTQRYQQRPICKDLVVEKVEEVSSSLNRRYSLTLEIPEDIDSDLERGGDSFEGDRRFL